jgi:hypothetical protein
LECRVLFSSALCVICFSTHFLKNKKENWFGFFLLPVFARIVQTLHLGRDFGDLIFELLSKSIKKKYSLEFF